MRLGVTAALVEGALLPGDVDLAGGRVAGLGLESGPGAAGIACPGFVDLQVNGFAGVDLQTADAAGFRHVGEELLRGGVTAYRPTFVTAPEERLVAALRSLPTTAGGARVLGVHLEGPFVAATRLCAHDPAGRRDPDLALLARLLDAGPVRQMTLAPELPGALELIDTLQARGVVAACGHSDASTEEALRAFDRGARTVTHLFNAMPAQGGLAAAALERDDVTVQLIADGRHVPADLMRLAWRSAAGRLALVTDAVAAAGSALTMRDAVAAAGGALTMRDAVAAAGSALTMRDAVANLHALGVRLEDALTAATAVPAWIAGTPRLGRLAVGEPADVIVLDDRLEVVRVLLAG